MHNFKNINSNVDFNAIIKFRNIKYTSILNMKKTLLKKISNKQLKIWNEFFAPVLK